MWIWICMPGNMNFIAVVKIISMSNIDEWRIWPNHFLTIKSMRQTYLTNWWSIRQLNTLLQDSVCMMINYSQLHFSYADIKSWQCLITSLFNYCYMIECMFTNTTTKYLLFTNWSGWKSTLLTCPTIERMYIVAKKATRNLNVQAGEFLHNILKSIK